MRARPLTILTLLLAGTAATVAPTAAQDADLIVYADHVWTADEMRPRAEAVAIRADRILAVGDSAAIARYRSADTRVIHAPDRFVAPGFHDNHTHFNRAGELILGVNLLDVSGETSLVRAVREARDRMPPGAWLVGGDWGAYEAWEMGSTGGEGSDASGRDAFRPHRAMIDSITPETPALLSRWDRSLFLANRRALALAGADCAWDGVECDAEGRTTGRLTAEGAARVREAIPPKSMDQRLAEAHAALERLRSFGVTRIHDITPPEQLVVFRELLRRGQLTTRVYARPTLDKWDDLSAVGIQHGFGGEWLEIGGLKGFVDGIMGNSSARFYEPYLTSGERGRWRTMMQPDGDTAVLGSIRPVDWAPADAGPMERLLLGADSAGHWPQVHAIGDEAIDTLLDMYERVVEINGPRRTSSGTAVSMAGPPGLVDAEADPRERRFRVIHAQVLRGPEVAERMARLGVIAEVQPYHAIDDMRWMEERIGERSRWAYAFKTMKDAGVLLSFGSDWPGTNASWYPANPVLGIYAAVTRQTLDGEPAGGWFPEERVDVETALRAYTINTAYAAGDETVEGSITAGKLADLVVLDRDPFTVAPAELRELRVLYTIVGGRIVYAADDANRISAACAPRSGRTTHASCDSPTPSTAPVP